jgi:DNA (cytosine-5)-methyltransferase 1
MRSVELFSGAGGLALGLAQAGFEHLAVIEWDKSACETLHENKSRVREMRHWNIFNADVRTFDYSFVPEGIDLLAGGVPCQPFSIGGKHRGHADERNMFPELVKVIRTIRPKAVLIENVRGLARRSFAKYFGYIELMLAHPEVARKSGEHWLDHLARLERHHTAGQFKGLSYRVVHRVLNAADYGVPQRRERLFFVAIRSDLKVEWSFPAPTHSAGALQWSQESGEYWREHAVKSRQNLESSNVLFQAESRDVGWLLPPNLQRWKTVRDALAEPFKLPPPAKKRSFEEPALTHFEIPGARSYVGHTGSPLDMPAKTLKAGVHGVPGGENTMLLQDGSVRYFTIRESARLQDFPDDFTFTGSWTESMRQIGNAVPASLGRILGANLKSVMERRSSFIGSSAL